MRLAAAAELAMALRTGPLDHRRGDPVCHGRELSAISHQPSAISRQLFLSDQVRPGKRRRRIGK
jgi:hypothetical protein